jgi:choloylglycine hydrolase
MGKRIIVSLFLLVIFLVGVSPACTDFQVKAKDGTVMIGRSMEFAMETDSQLVVFPRGDTLVSTTPQGKQGIKWVSKYGFLGINAFGQQRGVTDGMNEAGLSVELLWFVGSKYQQTKNQNFLSATDLAIWMLGNFATVTDVKKALARTIVVCDYAPQLKQVPGFHVAVHDIQGNNLVVEFINGEKKIYDNPIGVMTNRPSFDWQLTNLRSYINLGPADSAPKKIAGVIIEATGSGNGWLGLPGDWTPPSRFVRTVHFVHAAPAPKNADEALDLAQHVLNTVDIPYGVVKAQGSIPVIKPLYDYTQWCVIKDLTNRVLYFRAYRNMALKKVEMNKLNFAPDAEMKSIPVESVTDSIFDLTGKLL